MRVEILDHRRQGLHVRPDRRVVALGETFHLVADGPQQQGGMVPIGQDVPPHALELFGHHVEIVVVEAVPGMTEPVADHHRQTQLLGLVELLAEFRPHSPGAERVAPGGGQHVLRPIAAGAH